VLTQGLERAELQHEVAGVDGERRSTALCTGAGRGGAPPGAWTSRIDAGSCCEVGQGVSAGQGPPAAREFQGGAAHLS